MSLTDLQVRKLAPKSRRYEILDAGGLYVRVMPSGTKSWVFRYNFEGTPRRMTLGAYPGVGLAAAREKHGIAVADIQRGIDPGAAALAAKQKRKAAPTFGDLLDEFWTNELGKSPTGPERKRLVEKDALGPWRKKKVVDITRRDAVILLDSVRGRAPVVANRLQGVLVRMFNFAAERGIIDHSPLTGMRRPKEQARQRVLTDAEIKAFWKATDPEDNAVNIYRTTKLALRLILLTGQRPGEIAGMTWVEIDEDSKQWIIPAGRMKNAEEQVVPLCPLSWAQIQAAKPFGNGTGALFRSSHKPEGCAITRLAISQAVGRHWSALGGAEKWTPHDLRRTLRTRLAEIGIDDVTAEKVLGHKLQGVLGIYNRHAYMDEKRAALLKWENRLQEIVGDAEDEKSNVIQLRGRR